MHGHKAPPLVTYGSTSSLGGNEGKLGSTPRTGARLILQGLMDAPDECISQRWRADVDDVMRAECLALSTKQGADDKLQRQRARLAASIPVDSAIATLEPI
ncbi:hypothetical protein SVAN01_03962 [Stagonosporopsis vannaccii]|nr:hypothetical protein SVAN01_03962 [Stagonosporopsis vannaccii]